jgi:hypothetical protein
VIAALGSIVRCLRDRSEVQAVHMPKLELTEGQITTLAVYLSSLQ